MFGGATEQASGRLLITHPVRYDAQFAGSRLILLQLKNWMDFVEIFKAYNHLPSTFMISHYRGP